jgi:hypothetical protein
MITSVTLACVLLLQFGELEIEEIETAALNVQPTRSNIDCLEGRDLQLFLAARERERVIFVTVHVIFNGRSYCLCQVLSQHSQIIIISIM